MSGGGFMDIQLDAAMANPTAIKVSRKSDDKYPYAVVAAVNNGTRVSIRFRADGYARELKFDVKSGAVMAGAILQVSEEALKKRGLYLGSFIKGVKSVFSQVF
jgi:hypothetical protein